MGNLGRIHPLAQIPHLNKEKTSLEPAAKRAMMVSWSQTKAITNEVYLL